MASMASGVMRALYGAALVLCTGCSYAWDDYDPQLLPCSGMGLLSNDWEKTENDYWGAYPQAGAQIAAENGEVAIAFAPFDPPEYYYSALQSYRTHNLRNDHISVKVPKVPDSTASNTLFTLLHGAPSLTISKVFNNLTCVLGERSPGVEFAQSVSYDPVEHLHWRIRDDGSNTLCEASPDGQTWTIFGHRANAELGFELEDFYVHLAVAQDKDLAAPDEVRFGPVNGGRAPIGKWCDQ